MWYMMAINFGQILAKVIKKSFWFELITSLCRGVVSYIYLLLPLFLAIFALVKNWCVSFSGLFYPWSYNNRSAIKYTNKYTHKSTVGIGNIPSYCVLFSSIYITRRYTYITLCVKICVALLLYIAANTKRNALIFIWCWMRLASTHFFKPYFIPKVFMHIILVSCTFFPIDFFRSFFSNWLTVFFLLQTRTHTYTHTQTHFGSDGVVCKFWLQTIEIRCQNLHKFHLHQQWNQIMSSKMHK